MKELLRLWAKGVPTGFKNQTTGPTSHASMIYLENSLVCGHRGTTAPGWYAIPHFPEEIRRLKTGTSLDATEIIEQPRRDIRDRAGLYPELSSLEISNILCFSGGSRQFQAALEKFFFGHIVWHLFKERDFIRLINGLEVDGGHRFIPPAPEKWRNGIKTMSLIARDWKTFERLFIRVCQSLIELPHELKGLNTLQIMAVSNQRNDSEIKTYVEFRGQVLGKETKLIKLLVSHCYAVIQHRPDLKISITGPAISEDPALKRTEAIMEAMTTCRIPRLTNLMSNLVNTNQDWKTATEKASISRGFGFSDDEVDEFLAGTSDLLVGLSNVEFLDTGGEILEKGLQHPHRAYHWQMVFAQEWRRIFEGGLGVGGYEAVFELDQEDACLLEWWEKNSLR